MHKLKKLNMAMGAPDTALGAEESERQEIY